MNATWVLGLPTDHEKGAFLTLDLAGTNPPVCSIILSGQRGGSEDHTISAYISAAIEDRECGGIMGRYRRFSVQIIQKRHLGGNDDTPLPLGFMFSYPATQGYIDHGVLQLGLTALTSKKSRVAMKPPSCATL